MKSLISTLITVSALLATASSHAANYSAGVSLGSTGLGANFSLKNDLQFRSNDQVQTRLQISGLNVDDIDDIKYRGIRYEGDVDSHTARATMDWFPFTNRFFVSAGVDYSNYDVSLTADSTRIYDIGQHTVNKGDNVTTSLDIDDKGFSPYLGIGWGNRIGQENGFSFLAELGVLIPTGDADVDFSVNDPGNTVSAADIAAEKKQIEDDLEGLSAVASVGVTYHF